MTRWRKSSFSGGSNDCAEVGWVEAAPLVRDSKNPAGGMLVFESAAWRRFTEMARAARR